VGILDQQRPPRHYLIVSEIKGLHSPDLYALELDNPPDIENCCVLIEVSVGPKDEPGEEYFGVVVTTPRWLADHLSDREYLSGRHYLIVKRYDFEVVRSALYKQFQGVQGANWSEVAERLARYGQWEFEDYQPTLGHHERNGA
jgi:hypothetical protein